MPAIAPPLDAWPGLGFDAGLAAGISKMGGLYAAIVSDSKSMCRVVKSALGGRGEDGRPPLEVFSSLSATSTRFLVYLMEVLGCMRMSNILRELVWQLAGRC